MVEFDEEGVVRRLPDGGSERVRWEDLREVVIVTTDEGPFVDDVFWMLVGDHGGCAVPSESPGFEALMGRLQRLPGFDNDAVIRAMMSTENASFVCWRPGLVT